MLFLDSHAFHFGGQILKVVAFTEAKSSNNVEIGPFSQVD